MERDLMYCVTSVTSQCDQCPHITIHQQLFLKTLVKVFSLFNAAIFHVYHGGLQLIGSGLDKPVTDTIKLITPYDDMQQKVHSDHHFYLVASCDVCGMGGGWG